MRIHAFFSLHNATPPAFRSGGKSSVALLECSALPSFFHNETLSALRSSGKPPQDILKYDISNCNTYKKYSAAIYICQECFHKYSRQY